MNTNPDISLHG